MRDQRKLAERIAAEIRSVFSNGIDLTDAGDFDDLVDTIADELRCSNVLEVSDARSTTTRDSDQ